MGARKEFLMSFFFRNRVPIRGGEHLFEELEERIVLDATVDASIHDSLHGGTDVSHNWDLGYSSNPSVSLDHVLATGDLAAYPGDLASPYPSITLGVVGPTNGASVVDLSGSVRINGSPTVENMYCAVTYNPRPGTSSGIDSLMFSETTATDLEVTTPTSGDAVLARTWQFSGRYDSINAILATMQANMTTGFTGTAEIDITLTDSDHETDATAAPLVTRTLFISATASPTEVTTTAVGPTIDEPSSITATGGTGAAGVFSGIEISDMRAQVIDVGLAVYHGTLGGTAAIPGVQIIQNVASTSVSTPPGATSGNDWVPSWLYVRGNVTDINTYLGNLTYQRLGSYGTIGDATVDDILDVRVDDRGTNANPFWHGNPVSRASSVSIPIYY
jgi:hypothetical protein